MGTDDVIEEIEWWLHESIDEEEAPKDSFYVEKYEHAAIIRWGSKKGDFPQLGTGGFDKKHVIISSGELLEGGIIVADTDSKKTYDFEQMVWKFLTSTQMEGCKKGYEQTINCPDGDYKITVKS